MYLAPQNIPCALTLGNKVILYCTVLFLFEGHYMMVQSNSGITKDRARLISPVYNGTGATCHMTFKYHMFGASAGELIQISSCVERRKE